MHAVYKRNWILSGIVFLFRVVSRHLATPFTISPLLLPGSRSSCLNLARVKEHPQDQCKSAHGVLPSSIHLQNPRIWKNFQRNIAMTESKGDSFDKSSNEREGGGEEGPQLISGWDDGEDEGCDVDDPLFDEYCSVLDDFGCAAYEDLARNLDEKVFRWIRVEAKPDETLKDINTLKDIQTKIEQIQMLQESYGPCNLYKRQWHRRGFDVDDEASAQRINGDGPKPVASFSVLQFNALAEGLSAGPNIKTPFPIDDENNMGENNNKQKDAGYGGFSQVNFPEVCLDFSLRRWRILEVILGTSYMEEYPDTSFVERTPERKNGAFDILALEEIDRFRGFFAPLLRILGYEGLFMPKSKSPGVRLGFYSDGCALFWKTSTFELLSEHRKSFKLGNQVIIMATLKHIESGLPLVVAVTHLKAQKSETNEKIRCMQVEELISHVQETAKTEASARGVAHVPILIMGDFNADPPSEIPFSVSSIRRVLSNHMQTNDNPDEQPMKFRSAYPIDPIQDGLFTTWKTRGTDTVKRIIDYIFYSGSSLKCAGWLDVPAAHELEESKLPGLRHPSDHMMIGARFDLFS